MEILPILVLLIICSSVFGIFYLFITTRNKERILMIEKGFDPQQFLKRPKNGPGVFTYWTLKLGMLAIGISLGVLVAFVVSSPHDEVMVVSIFLFAGLSLVANFFTERKIWKSEGNN